MKRWLAGLLFAASAQAQDAALPAPQALSPEAVVELFHQSLKEGYADKALEQLAADVKIFETGYIERSREEYAREHLGKDMYFAAATERVIGARKVSVDSGAAWVLTQSTLTGEIGGKPIALEQTETMLLLREVEGWRIAHIHWSAHNSEAPAAAKKP